MNSPPTLAIITNRTINEGQLLVITNTATDNDLPPNKLTFSLRSPFPAGTAVNVTNGIFTWRPKETQGPSTNTIAVMVADNGSPNLSATQPCVVVVRDNLSDLSLTFGRTNLLAGERGTVPLTLRSSLELTNLTLWLDAPPMHLTNLSLGRLGAR